MIRALSPEYIMKLRNDAARVRAIEDKLFLEVCPLARHQQALSGRDKRLLGKRDKHLKTSNVKTVMDFTDRHPTAITVSSKTMLKQTPEQAHRFYQTTRLAAWRATRFKNAALAEVDPEDHKIQGLYYTDFVRRVNKLGAKGDERSPMPPLLSPYTHLPLRLDGRIPLYDKKCYKKVIKETPEEESDAEEEEATPLLIKKQIKVQQPKKVIQRRRKIKLPPIRQSIDKPKEEPDFIPGICDWCAKDEEEKAAAASLQKKSKGFWRRSHDVEVQTDRGKMIVDSLFTEDFGQEMTWGWADLSHVSVSSLSISSTSYEEDDEEEEKPSEELADVEPLDPDKMTMEDIWEEVSRKKSGLPHIVHSMTSSSFSSWCKEIGDRVHHLEQSALKTHADRRKKSFPEVFKPPPTETYPQWLLRPFQTVHTMSPKTLEMWCRKVNERIALLEKKQPPSAQTVGSDFNLRAAADLRAGSQRPSKKSQKVKSTPPPPPSPPPPAEETFSPEQEPGAKHVHTVQSMSSVSLNEWCRNIRDRVRDLETVMSVPGDMAGECAVGTEDSVSQFDLIRHPKPKVFEFEFEASTPEAVTRETSETGVPCFGMDTGPDRRLHVPRTVTSMTANSLDDWCQDFDDMLQGRPVKQRPDHGEIVFVEIPDYDYADAVDDYSQEEQDRSADIQDSEYQQDHQLWKEYPEREIKDLKFKGEEQTGTVKEKGEEQTGTVKEKEEKQTGTVKEKGEKQTGTVKEKEEKQTGTVKEKGEKQTGTVKEKGEKQTGTVKEKGEKQTGTVKEKGEKQTGTVKEKAQASETKVPEEGQKSRLKKIIDSLIISAKQLVDKEESGMKFAEKISMAKEMKKEKEVLEVKPVEKEVTAQVLEAQDVEEIEKQFPEYGATTVESHETEKEYQEQKRHDQDVQRKEKETGLKEPDIVAEEEQENQDEQQSSNEEEKDKEEAQDIMEVSESRSEYPQQVLEDEKLQEVEQESEMGETQEIEQEYPEKETGDDENQKIDQNYSKGPENVVVKKKKVYQRATEDMMDSTTHNEEATSSIVSDKSQSEEFLLCPECKRLVLSRDTEMDYSPFFPENLDTCSTCKNPSTAAAYKMGGKYVEEIEPFKEKEYSDQHTDQSLETAAADEIGKHYTNEIETTKPEPLENGITTQEAEKYTANEQETEDVKARKVEEIQKGSEKEKCPQVTLSVRDQKPRPVPAESVYDYCPECRSFVPFSVTEMDYGTFYASVLREGLQFCCACKELFIPPHFSIQQRPRMECQHTKPSGYELKRPCECSKVPSCPECGCLPPFRTGQIPCSVAKREHESFVPSFQQDQDLCRACQRHFVPEPVSRQETQEAAISLKTKFKPIGEAKELSAAKESQTDYSPEEIQDVKLKAEQPYEITEKEEKKEEFKEIEEICKEHIEEIPAVKAQKIQKQASETEALEEIERKFTESDKEVEQTLDTAAADEMEKHYVDKTEGIEAQPKIDVVTTHGSAAAEEQEDTEVSKVRDVEENQTEDQYSEQAEEDLKATESKYESSQAAQIEKTKKVIEDEDAQKEAMVSGPQTVSEHPLADEAEKGAVKEYLQQGKEALGVREALSDYRQQVAEIENIQDETKEKYFQEAADASKGPKTVSEYPEQVADTEGIQEGAEKEYPQQGMEAVGVPDKITDYPQQLDEFQKTEDKTKEKYFQEAADVSEGPKTVSEYPEQVAEVKDIKQEKEKEYTQQAREGVDVPETICDYPQQVDECESIKEGKEEKYAQGVPEVLGGPKTVSEYPQQVAETEKIQKAKEKEYPQKAMEQELPEVINDDVQLVADDEIKEEVDKEYTQQARAGVEAPEKISEYSQVAQVDENVKEIQNKSTEKTGKVLEGPETQYLQETLECPETAEEVLKAAESKYESSQAPQTEETKKVIEDEDAQKEAMVSGPQIVSEHPLVDEAEEGAEKKYLHQDKEALGVREALSDYRQQVAEIENIQDETEDDDTQEAADVLEGSKTVSEYPQQVAETEGIQEVAEKEYPQQVTETEDIQEVADKEYPLQARQDVEVPETVSDHPQVAEVETFYEGVEKESTQQAPKATDILSEYPQQVDEKEEIQAAVEKEILEGPKTDSEYPQQVSVVGEIKEGAEKDNQQAIEGDEVPEKISEYPQVAHAEENIEEIAEKSTKQVGKDVKVPETQYSREVSEGDTVTERIDKKHQEKISDSVEVLQETNDYPEQVEEVREIKQRTEEEYAEKAEEVSESPVTAHKEAMGEYPQQLKETAEIPETIKDFPKQAAKVKDIQQGVEKEYTQQAREGVDVPETISDYPQQVDERESIEEGAEEKYAQEAADVSKGPKTVSEYPQNVDEIEQIKKITEKEYPVEAESAKKEYPQQIVETKLTEEEYPQQVVETKLTEKEYSPQVVETKLTEKEYPPQVVETKLTEKEYPPQVVETKLTEKEYPPQVVETKLTEEEYPQQVAEVENIKEKEKDYTQQAREGKVPETIRESSQVAETDEIKEEVKKEYVTDVQKGPETVNKYSQKVAATDEIEKKAEKEYPLQPRQVVEVPETISEYPPQVDEAEEKQKVVSEKEYPEQARKQKEVLQTKYPQQATKINDGAEKEFQEKDTDLLDVQGTISEHPKQVTDVEEVYEVKNEISQEEEKVPGGPESVSGSSEQVKDMKTIQEQAENQYVEQAVKAAEVTKKIDRPPPKVTEAEVDEIKTKQALKTIAADATQKEFLKQEIDGEELAEENAPDSAVVQKINQVSTEPDEVEDIKRQFPRQEIKTVPDKETPQQSIQQEFDAAVDVEPMYKIISKQQLKTVLREQPEQEYRQVSEDVEVTHIKPIYPQQVTVVDNICMIRKYPLPAEGAVTVKEIKTRHMRHEPETLDALQRAQTYPDQVQDTLKNPEAIKNYSQQVTGTAKREETVKTFQKQAKDDYEDKEEKPETYKGTCDIVFFHKEQGREFTSVCEWPVLAVPSTTKQPQQIVKTEEKVKLQEQTKYDYKEDGKLNTLKGTSENVSIRKEQDREVVSVSEWSVLTVHSLTERPQEIGKREKRVKTFQEQTKDDYEEKEEKPETYEGTCEIVLFHKEQGREFTSVCDWPVLAEPSSTETPQKIVTKEEKGKTFQEQTKYDYKDEKEKPETFKETCNIVLFHKEQGREFTSVCEWPVLAVPCTTEQPTEIVKTEEKVKLRQEQTKYDYKEDGKLNTLKGTSENVSIRTEQDREVVYVSEWSVLTVHSITEQPQEIVKREKQVKTFQEQTKDDYEKKEEKPKTCEETCEIVLFHKEQGREFTSVCDWPVLAVPCTTEQPQDVKREEKVKTFQEQTKGNYEEKDKKPETYKETCEIVLFHKEQGREFTSVCDWPVLAVPCTTEQPQNVKRQQKVKTFQEQTKDDYEEEYKKLETYEETCEIVLFHKEQGREFTSVCEWPVLAVPCTTKQPPEIVKTEEKVNLRQEQTKYDYKEEEKLKTSKGTSENVSIRKEQDREVVSVSEWSVLTVHSLTEQPQEIVKKEKHVKTFQERTKDDYEEKEEKPETYEACEIVLFHKEQGREFTSVCDWPVLAVPCTTIQPQDVKREKQVKTFQEQTKDHYEEKEEKPVTYEACEIVLFHKEQGRDFTSVCEWPVLAVPCTTEPIGIGKSEDKEKSCQEQTKYDYKDEEKKPETYKETSKIVLFHKEQNREFTSVCEWPVLAVPCAAKQSQKIVKTDEEVKLCQEQTKDDYEEKEEKPETFKGTCEIVLFHKEQGREFTSVCDWPVLAVPCTTEQPQDVKREENVKTFQEQTKGNYEEEEEKPETFKGTCEIVLFHKEQGREFTSVCEWPVLAVPCTTEQPRETGKKEAKVKSCQEKTKDGYEGDGKLDLSKESCKIVSFRKEKGQEITSVCEWSVLTVHSPTIQPQEIVKREEKVKTFQEQTKNDYKDEKEKLETYKGTCEIVLFHKEQGREFTSVCEWPVLAVPCTTEQPTEIVKSDVPSARKHIPSETDIFSIIQGSFYTELASPSEPSAELLSQKDLHATVQVQERDSFFKDDEPYCPECASHGPFMTRYSQISVERREAELTYTSLINSFFQEDQELCSACKEYRRPTPVNTQQPPQMTERQEAYSEVTVKGKETEKVSFFNSCLEDDPQLCSVCREHCLSAPQKTGCQEIYLEQSLENVDSEEIKKAMAELGLMEIEKQDVAAPKVMATVKKITRQSPETLEFEENKNEYPNTQNNYASVVPLLKENDGEFPSVCEMPVVSELLRTPVSKTNITKQQHVERLTGSTQIQDIEKKGPGADQTMTNPLPPVQVLKRQEQEVKMTFESSSLATSSDLGEMPPEISSFFADDEASGSEEEDKQDRHKIMKTHKRATYASKSAESSSSSEHVTEESSDRSRSLMKKLADDDKTAFENYQSCEIVCKEKDYSSSKNDYHEVHFSSTTEPLPGPSNMRERRETAKTLEGMEVKDEGHIDDVAQVSDNIDILSLVLTEISGELKRPDSRILDNENNSFCPEFADAECTAASSFLQDELFLFSSCRNEQSKETPFCKVCSLSSPPTTSQQPFSSLSQETDTEDNIITSLPKEENQLRSQLDQAWQMYSSSGFDTGSKELANNCNLTLNCDSNNSSLPNYTIKTNTMATSAYDLSNSSPKEVNQAVACERDVKSFFRMTDCRQYHPVTTAGTHAQPRSTASPYYDITLPLTLCASSRSQAETTVGSLYGIAAWQARDSGGK